MICLRRGRAGRRTQMNAEQRMRRFAGRAEAENLPVDAAQIWLDGRLAAEKRWKPDEPHVIYSQTKSFVCSAIGTAVCEGALSPDDSLARWFPDYVTPENEGDMTAVTLRHLLTMSSGRGEALLMGDQRRSGGAGKDYLRFVLDHPLKHAPGTCFCYSNGDTYLAGRMLERAVREPLLPYLKRRLLDPLDIVCTAWEDSPEGHFFGASGMLLRTSEMARLGLLYLSGGEWEGRRVLDPSWIGQASSVRQPTGKTDPWDSHYGYQLWHMDHLPGAFRFDGAGGQYSILIPGRNLLFVTSCSVASVQPLRKPSTRSFSPIRKRSDAILFFPSLSELKNKAVYSAESVIASGTERCYDLPEKV